MNDTILCGVATLPSDQMDLHKCKFKCCFDFGFDLGFYRLGGDSFSAMVLYRYGSWVLFKCQEFTGLQMTGFLRFYIFLYILIHFEVFEQEKLD